MKRKIPLILLALVAVYFLVGEAKDLAVDLYFAHWHERATAHPAGPEADQIVLTWPGDPATTAAVNWRTDTSVTEGEVAYRPAGAEAGEAVEATYTLVTDSLLTNDPEVHRWTAELTGLTPDTVYAYRVGAGGGTWSDWTEFTTGHGAAAPFSFVYLGDPQQGLDEWGALVRESYARHPQSAFYVIAGDLVNSGEWRDEWDAFFEGSASVFGRVPIVPSLGNHDVDDALEAELYLESFALPENGPATVGEERAFSFTYGNALFVVLDSNLDASTQTPWLEEQLANSDATWKFAIYHHPAYPSRRARENPEILEQWGGLFDEYHVDMALQGHDHAYLRTYPMNAGQRVDSAAEGTYYVVSVSGTKFYEQMETDYAEVAFENVMTYQVIDIDTNPDRLTYRAYDGAGDVLDEVVIEK